MFRSLYKADCTQFKVVHFSKFENSWFPTNNACCLFQCSYKRSYSCRDLLAPFSVTVLNYEMRKAYKHLQRSETS